VTKSDGPSSSLERSNPGFGPDNRTHNRFRQSLDAWKARTAKFLRWAFCPHRRVLVKIVPHDGISVYKLELSHRHLSFGCIAAAVLLLVLLGIHVSDVQTAEARLRTLAKVNAQQHQALSVFSKETRFLWQKVGKLQRDDEEIHRLTKIIVPKSAGHPAARPAVAGSQQYSLGTPPVWRRIAAWFGSLPGIDFGFAAEASELNSLSRAVSDTGTQTAALESRVRAAAQRTIAAELARERYLAAIPSIWPTLGYISSGFGYRSYPDAEFHSGLDIVNDYGAPIYATAAGVVVEAGWYYGYGLRVVIDHGNGLQTWYAHDSQILVSVGQVVKKGQEIALVGESGFATGPHCHYQIELWGKPIDPTPYLNGSVTVVASN
jgi:murein DD-endopeptidase MepM/ murein hydrolase activator NlpD